MARFNERNVSETYKAAEHFRRECLLRNGSLLFEGTDLWSAENLAKLHKAFVEAPDTGTRSFTEKFRDQVTPAGQTVLRLAAEALSVYFLFPSNVGGFRKRELVSEVLGWGGDTLPSDNDVFRAFERGIGSGGQGFNTRRPWELGFLISFVHVWKKLRAPEQAKALSDPWKFKELLDATEEGAENKQMRHMLLHLLFPDEFERIASGRHKRRILEAFSGLVEDAEQDDDKNLLVVRRALEKLLPGKELDFYWEPLRGAWHDLSDAGEDDLAPLELVHHKKQVVLFGPPGTGKTYSAKLLAERIIRSAALKSMGPTRYFKDLAVVDAAVKDANVHRLQLHPAYSYEDFIRGLHVAEGGATEYRLGYLPLLAKEIKESKAEPRLPHVLILDEINRTDLSRMLGEAFSLLEDRNQVVELPARGKGGEKMAFSIPADLYVIGTMNLIDQSIEQVDFALRRRFLWIECPFDPEALVEASKAIWGDKQAGQDWDRVEPDFRKLATAATLLNQEVKKSPLLGAQYEIGHTYFFDVVSFLVNYLEASRRGRKNMLWSKKDALQPVHQVWRLSLRPLLHEYLSGLDAGAREAELKRLGEVFLTPPAAE
ncbi:MAG TPA: AAA family ATPase [bacterium]|nr:AAA family ATPase [bacterium]